MTFATLPPIRTSLASVSQGPGKGAKLQAKLRVLKAEFGDGYQQRAVDGINIIAETWTVTWPNCRYPEAKAAYDFLTGLGAASPFYWTPPGEPAPKLWTCEDPAIGRDDGGIATLSATFERSYALG